MLDYKLQLLGGEETCLLLVSQITFALTKHITSTGAVRVKNQRLLLQLQSDLSIYYSSFILMTSILNVLDLIKELNGKSSL